TVTVGSDNAATTVTLTGGDYDAEVTNTGITLYGTTPATHYLKYTDTELELSTVATFKATTIDSISDGLLTIGNASSTLTIASTPTFSMDVTMASALEFNDATAATISMTDVTTATGPTLTVAGGTTSGATGGDVSIVGGNGGTTKGSVEIGVTTTEAVTIGSGTLATVDVETTGDITLKSSTTAQVVVGADIGLKGSLNYGSNAGVITSSASMSIDAPSAVLSVGTAATTVNVGSASTGIDINGSSVTVTGAAGLTLEAGAGDLSVTATSGNLVLYDVSDTKLTLGNTSDDTVIVGDTLSVGVNAITVLESNASGAVTLDSAVSQTLKIGTGVIPTSITVGQATMADLNLIGTDITMTGTVAIDTLNVPDSGVSTLAGLIVDLDTQDHKIHCAAVGSGAGDSISITAGQGITDGGALNLDSGSGTNSALNIGVTNADTITVGRSSATLVIDAPTVNAHGATLNLSATASLVANALTFDTGATITTAAGDLTIDTANDLYIQAPSTKFIYIGTDDNAAVHVGMLSMPLTSAGVLRPALETAATPFIIGGGKNTAGAGGNLSLRGGNATGTSGSVLLGDVDTTDVRLHSPMVQQSGTAVLTSASGVDTKVTAYAGQNVNVVASGVGDVVLSTANTLSVTLDSSASSITIDANGTTLVLDSTGHTFTGDVLVTSLTSPALTDLTIAASGSQTTIISGNVSLGDTTATGSFEIKDTLVYGNYSYTDVFVDGNLPGSPARSLNPDYDPKSRPVMVPLPEGWTSGLVTASISLDLDASDLGGRDHDTTKLLSLRQRYLPRGVTKASSAVPLSTYMTDAGQGSWLGNIGNKYTISTSGSLFVNHTHDGTKVDITTAVMSQVSLPLRSSGFGINTSTTGQADDAHINLMVSDTCSLLTEIVFVAKVLNEPQAYLAISAVGCTVTDSEGSDIPMYDDSGSSSGSANLSVRMFYNEFGTTSQTAIATADVFLSQTSGDSAYDPVLDNAVEVSTPATYDISLPA
ncbi:hypothetical protein KIPB_009140, partial [Kipferlia bialata]